MTRRWWVLAAFGLLAVLASVPTVLLLTADVTSPTPTPTVASAHTEAPSSPSDVARRPEEIARFLWWRLGWRALGDTAPPDFETLTIGWMGGEVLGQVQIGSGAFFGVGAGPPFVIGPSDGLILYAMRRGDGTELHLVDADAERDDVLVTSPALLHHAALGARSRLAYFATGPGKPGIWRVPLDGSAAPELVANPPELAGLEIVLAAPIDALPKQVTLRLDEAEEHLAVLTCTRSCTLRVLDLANGADTVVEGLDPARREITDFVGGRVVIGESAFEARTGDLVLAPDGANDRVDIEKGWELPEGWSLEERAVNPNAMVVGATRFVAIGPDGEELPIDAMGQGTGQG